MPRRTASADESGEALPSSVRTARKERFAHLPRMISAERTTATLRDELTLAECLAWSRRRPNERPRIGRELAYVVTRTPEWLGDR